MCEGDNPVKPASVSIQNGHHVKLANIDTLKEIK